MHKNLIQRFSIQWVENFLKGFISAIPLGISVFIYGIVFGVLSQKAGLSIAATLAMSLFIFAGASQMTTIQMISLGGDPFTIITTVLIINLRHFLMAASLSPYLKKVSSGVKMINAYFLTDESYAVTYSYFQQNKPSASFFLGSSLNIYMFWISATTTGFIFGNIIPAQVKYILDFAFAAAFIGMLIPLIKKFPTIVTVLTSACISIWGCLYLPGKWYIIIAVLISSFCGCLANSAKNRITNTKLRSTRY